MLTLFTTPRPFVGEFSFIQWNALKSWTLLRPRPEVILIGDEQGAAEVSRELGLIHVPGVRRSPLSDMPMVGDLFGLAERTGGGDHLCYLNSDIILLDDFLPAVDRVSASFRGRFLMVARVWLAKLQERLDFSDPQWQARLREEVQLRASQAPPPGNSDFYLYPRGHWGPFPDFAYRGPVDAWMVYETRRMGAPVVDVSDAVMTIHQGHGVPEYRGGLRAWRQELSRTEDLIGREAARFCLWDATHLLIGSDLRPARRWRHLLRRWSTLPLFHPVLAAPLHALRGPLALLRALRSTWRTLTDPFERLKRRILSVLPRDGVTAILGMTSQDSTLWRASYWLLRTGHPIVVDVSLPAAREIVERSLSGPIGRAMDRDRALSGADVVLVPPGDELGRGIRRSGEKPVVVPCPD